MFRHAEGTFFREASHPVSGCGASFRFSRKSLLKMRFLRSV
ncbi:hypothetical protein ACFPRL_12535 [Pseudoclavibacter helvolus]